MSQNQLPLSQTEDKRVAEAIDTVRQAFTAAIRRQTADGETVRAFALLDLSPPTAPVGEPSEGTRRLFWRYTCLGGSIRLYLES